MENKMEIILTAHKKKKKKAGEKQTNKKTITLKQYKNTESV